MSKATESLLLGTQSDGSYTSEQVVGLLRELRDEPEWRDEAVRAEEFYDGHQLNVETLRTMQSNGIPPTIFNMIQPLVNSVTGFEVQNRTDITVLPENDQSIEGAQGLNQLMKEATRLTDFNRECGAAFRSAVVTGIGWALVTRNADPFGYPYRVENIPWREMWWDWRSRKPDLSDARYILRRVWFDRDSLATQLPESRALLDDITSSWPTGGLVDSMDVETPSGLGRALGAMAGDSLDDQEWFDDEHRRIALFEVLYRVPYRAVCLRFPEGETIELVKDDPLHQELILSGQAQIVVGPTWRLRQAFYLGPHRLRDRPMASRDYPYVPFVTYRQGGDRTPYGLVRAMLSPQEAYNARYSRVLHDLSSRRVIVSDDAVNDHAQTAAEINRPDSYIILNADRGPNSIFEFAPNTETSAISMNLMTRAANDMQVATGIFPEFRGQSAGQNQSGAALNQLYENSVQTLGGVWEQYRYARRDCGRRLLNEIRRNIMHRPNMSVRVEKTPLRSAKEVTLNGQNPDTAERTNQVVMLRTQVALDEQRHSVTHRQQTMMLFSELYKAMPAQLQVPLTDIMLSLMDVPNADEAREIIRGITGVGPEPDDPQEAQRQAQEAQQQQAIEQRIAEIEMLEREARARKTLADALLTQVKARKAAGVDTQYTEAKVAHEWAKMGASEGEQERAELEQQRLLIESGTKIAQNAQTEASGESI